MGADTRVLVLLSTGRRVLPLRAGLPHRMAPGASDAPVSEVPMKAVHTLFVVVVVTGLAACSDMPPGPTVPVMPAPGKPFDVFQEENAYCKQYASEEISGSESATKKVAGSAAAGAVLGAVAGTLMGDSRNAAGAGAATGALFGTAAGAGAADQSGRGLQQR